MAVDVRCEVAHGRQFVPLLRKDAGTLLRLLNLSSAELSILLTDDAAIRELNREYRSKDQPTDVLSFSQMEGIESNELPLSEQVAGIEGPPRTLGDIVIALDTASRQAAALALPVAARLRTLLIHGLLHLLGYDHERSSAEARRMFARERALAAQLDRPATLAAPSVRPSTTLPKRAIPSKLASEFP